MVTDQTPPHDEAAELSVLGTMLLTPARAFSLLSGLRVDDFFLPEHREAWAAILAVQSRGMPVDVVSVGDELKARGMWPRFKGGWQTWATACAGQATAPEIAEAHGKIIRQKVTLRRLIALCVEVQAAAYSTNDLDDIMARARDGVAELEVNAADEGPIKIGDSLHGALQVVEDRTAGKRIAVVDSGISTVDDILGGHKPQQLIVVAARPSAGKTAFVKRVALNVAKRKIPVLVFSLEMARQELIERDFSLEGRIEAFKIGSGRLTVDDWHGVQDAGNRLYEVPMWLDDQTVALGQIIAQARRWHAKEVRTQKHEPDEIPLGLIAIDYLQLVHVDFRKGETREHEVSRVSRALKSLAKELRVPIIAVSQLSRAIEKRGGRPVLSDLRESGTIEQDADVVIFVYRDIPPEDAKSRRESGEGEAIIGKHRGGPTGIAKLWWEAPLMEWRALDSHREPPRDRTGERDEP